MKDMPVFLGQVLDQPSEFCPIQSKKHVASLFRRLLKFTYTRCLFNELCGRLLGTYLDFRWITSSTYLH